MKKKLWDKEDLRRALAACRATPPMSKRAESMELGVPRKTLSGSLMNKVLSYEPKWSKDAALTADEEIQLSS